MIWADWRETYTDILTVNNARTGKQTRKPKTPKDYIHPTAKEQRLKTYQEASGLHHADSNMKQ